MSPTGLLLRVQPTAALQTVGMLFSPGYPGFLRGVAAFRGGEFRRDDVRWPGGSVSAREQAKPSSWQTDSTSCTVVATRAGAPSSPNWAPGACCQSRGQGRRPWRPDWPIRSAAIRPGRCPAGHGVGGRAVVALTESGVETVVGELRRPQGILVRRTALHRRRRHQGTDRIRSGQHTSGVRSPQTCRSGPPPGVAPKPLKGLPPFSGPQGPFAGITAAPDGTLYVSADGDGSVLALRRMAADRHQAG